MRIGVVVPVVQVDKWEVLAGQILDNSIVPEKIVAIDNSKSFGLDPYGHILTMRGSETIGVNASWEIGARLCGDVDIVSILNDDIEITPTFFENVIKAFKETPDAGAICPNTLTPKKKSIKESAIKPMRRVEGWAFSIKKEILNAAYPMPEHMEIFAGDNWLWWFSHFRCRLGWFKDYSINIFHHVGSSQTQRTRSRLKKERAICTQNLKKHFPERYGIEEDK